MTTARSLVNLLALIALAVAGSLPPSPLQAWVRYLALSYLMVSFLLRVRAGYLRRKPHWTPESWRRYLMVGSVPLIALVLMVGMMCAVEWRLPIVGGPRSPERGVWVAGITILLIFGAIGTSVMVEWLNNGEASRQFTLPRWLSRSRRS
jgi:hypothetical protein